MCLGVASLYLLSVDQLVVIEELAGCDVGVTSASRVVGYS